MKPRASLAMALSWLLAGCALGPHRPLPADGCYQVGRSADATETGLRQLAVTVHQATLAPDGLVVRLGFANRTAQRYTIEGPGLAEKAELRDSAGRAYRARNVSDGLLAVAPPGGFDPGAANVGDVTFARPRSGGPYVLTVRGFAPLRFDLTARQQPPRRLPDGEFQLDVALPARDPSLTMVELRVEAVRLASDVRLTVGFANVTRQGWTLSHGPQGGDARLLDAEGTAVPPLRVSDELRASIAPAGGWKPGQVNRGDLVFPRPRLGGPLRLVFPHFDALVLVAEGTGVRGRAGTATGDVPAPAPEADRQDAVYVSLRRLLDRQAQALLQPDGETYAGTFTVPLRDAQRQFARRVGGLPLETYSLEPSPDAALKPDEDGKLHDVPILVRYHLRNVPANNEFMNVLRYDFAPSANGDGWRVSRVVADRNAPFWQLGPVVVRNTPHFLLLTRPNAEPGGTTLANEVEAAYTRLAQLGLPLAPRYVGHVTTTQAEFSSLAGRDSETAGVATWRYDVTDDRVKVYSRTFYLNGACLTRGGDHASERRTTIVHELAHLALADDTRPLTPPWLTEGMAVYFSGETTAGARRQLVAEGLDRVDLATLTRADRLGEPRPGLSKDGRQARFEYDFSGQVVAYLMAAAGQPAVLSFYGGFTGVPVREKSDRRAAASTEADAHGGESRTRQESERSAEATEALLQSHFGHGVASLDLAVKQWLRR